jgi:hypothetical protein
MRTTSITVAASALLAATGLAHAGAVATFAGGVLTGTANTEVQGPGGGFDSDGAGFSALTATMASGGTDSGIVTADTAVFGSASLSATSIIARRPGGVNRVEFEASASARIDAVGQDVFFASQSIAIGPAGVPGNFLAINVDQDTEFTFDFEIVNPSENSSQPSIFFSAGDSGTLLAGEDYFLTWNIGAFASLNTASLFDDVEVRATLLLPSPGAAGVIGCAAFVAARRRR